MARKIIKVRRIGGISTMKELREAQREVDLKLWYAGERLADDITDTFSLDNLLSLIAPPGSQAERMVDGFSTGLATVRGIIKAVEAFRSRRN